MQATGPSTSPFVLTLLVVVLGLLWALTPRGSQAEVVPSGTVYISPSYGYILFLGVGRIELTIHESPDPSVETLALTTDAGPVTLEAFEGFEGDSESCLSHAENELLSNPRLEQVAPALFDTGEPVELRRDGIASRAYMTVDSGMSTSSGFTVWELTCMTLVERKAVLRATYIVPAENYLAGTPVISDIHLPRAAFGTLEGPPYVGCRLPSYPAAPPAVMLDDDGNETGAISVLLLESGLPGREVTLMLSFENTGTASLDIDPLGLHIDSVLADDLYFPIDGSWVTHSAGATLEALELQPGEIAVARIVFPPDTIIPQASIVYADESRGAVVIGETGGGCAGYRPAIRIGID